MERSIPQPHSLKTERGWEAALREASGVVFVTALIITFLCLYLYVNGRPGRPYGYIHFVWQADAWLHGQLSVPLGTDSQAGITYQDVMPIVNDQGISTNRGLIPFPPLPAALLLPFVALFQLPRDQDVLAGIQQGLAMALGAIDVLIAYWLLGALPIRFPVRVLTTLFFGLGTVLWYAAATGTTWFFAHLVAVACLLLAVGVALRSDRSAAEPGPVAVEPVGGGTIASRVLTFIGEAFRFNRWQVLAGFLFGLAVTARLTVIFGFPFFMLVGGGGNWIRRSGSAALGAAIPVAALLLYTYAATGHLFNPAYDYLYHQELGYTFLHYNPNWSIEDIRYIPQNFGIMFFNLPKLFPTTDGNTLLCAAGQTRELFDKACPMAIPDTVGTSILLSSPAFLMAPFALRPLGALKLDRATAGATMAVVAIAFANLMHFSQGWVQFGYRFSNDFIPFALVLVALGATRVKVLWPFLVLVIASIAMNYWGVQWGGLLGW